MESTVIGWREWLALPDLGVPAIKAKIDTGARTSALHVVGLETLEVNNRSLARFRLHPLPRRTDVVLECQSEIIDRRWVSDSGGHREWRPVILSTVRLGGQQWPIEITLTDRDNMLFRMLLGRTAMTDRLIVDPSRSYLCGRRVRPSPYSRSAR